MTDSWRHFALTSQVSYIHTYIHNRDSDDRFVRETTGSPSFLYEPHREHNMASNYKALYGIFYKISMKVEEEEEETLHEEKTRIQKNRSNQVKSVK